MAGLSWPARAGHRWAKIVLLLFCIPGNVFYLRRLPYSLAPWPQTALTLLCTVLQRGAIVLIVRDLLYRPVLGTTDIDAQKHNQPT